jgi:hypothetical protein
MTRPPLYLVEHPRDYPEPFVFVPSHNAPTFGERLVTFFRFNGDLLTGILVGIALGGLLTSALAYVIARVML